MLVLKQCKCGGTTFVKEYDDDVMRCEECWSRAEFVYVKEETDDKEGGR